MKGKNGAEAARRAAAASEAAARAAAERIRALEEQLREARQQHEAEREAWRRDARERAAQMAQQLIEAALAERVDDLVEQRVSESHAGAARKIFYLIREMIPADRAVILSDKLDRIPEIARALGVPELAGELNAILFEGHGGNTSRAARRRNAQDVVKDMHANTQEDYKLRPPKYI